MCSRELHRKDIIEQTCRENTQFLSFKTCRMLKNFFKNIYEGNYSLEDGSKDILAHKKASLFNRHFGFFNCTGRQKFIFSTTMKGTGKNVTQHNSFSLYGEIHLKNFVIYFIFVA